MPYIVLILSKKTTICASDEGNNVYFAVIYIFINLFGFLLDKLIES